MESVTILTKNNRETQRVAVFLAKECVRGARRKHALILGLVGDLGGGKTTFTAGFARGLGIKKRVTSPTFVLMKIFKIPARHAKNLKSKILNLKFLIHIDAYRLDTARELLMLGWKEMTLDPRNIVVIEWADKVKKILPKESIIIKFKYLGEDTREIKIIQNAGYKK